MKYVAITAFAGLCCILPQAAKCQKETTITLHALPADFAADAVGVNTHLGYLNTYGPVWSTIIRPRLLESGIRHIRDENRDSPQVVAEYRDLANNGITGLLINSTYAKSLIDNVKSLNSTLPKFVDAVEPPNERDVASPDWINILSDAQKSLWTDYRYYKSLRNIWVLGPSFANTRDSPSKFHEGAPVAGAQMDHGNLHDYPGGQWPEGMYGGGWGITLDKSVAAYRLICGEKPLVSGETGYHNAVGYGGQPGVSERAAAKYMPRLILEHLRRGFVRTYFYEFYDQRVDPKDLEQNFGMVHHDGSPKLQFSAIKSFISLLSDKGVPFKPGSLTCVLSGDTADVYTMLFQKRDGRFFLALWQGVNSFDTQTNKDLEQPSKLLTITFTKPFASIKTYLPSVAGTTLQSRTANSKTLTVQVPDHLLILELDSKSEAQQPKLAGLSSVPPGAAAEAYTRCILNDTPKSEDIAPGSNGRYKWFSGQWYFGDKAPSQDHYRTEEGAIALSLGGDIVSTPRDFSQGILPLLSGAAGFYVEFDVRLSDNDPDHWPAVWLMPAEHNSKQADHYDPDPQGFERWMELDVDEGGFGPGLLGTVHNWHGIWPDYKHESNPNNISLNALDRTKTHTFGCSFNPKTSIVTWWLDGVKQMSAGTPYISPAAVKQNYYMILSAQSQGKQKPYTMYVSGVRAFGSG